MRASCPVSAGLLFLALSGLLSGCSGNGGGTTPRGGVTTITQLSVSQAGGSFALPGELESVRFEVIATGAQSGSALFELPDGTQLISVVTGPDTATVTWEGTVVDGSGVLTPDEALALSQIDTAVLGQAIRTVALDLGCAAPDLPPAAMAALVFPWQLVLAYRSPDAAAEARDFAAASTCSYFPDLTGEASTAPAPTSLLLSNDTPWPVVFGFFPFDETAMEEVDYGTATMPLPGAPVPAASAPCGGTCRGACGVDCTTTNCTVSDQWRCDVDDAENNLGTKRRWRIYNCGIHAGCVWHDDCYDTCNADHMPCGSKRAAWCRHNTVNGCDVTAAYYHGPVDCALWATGRGEFTTRMDFPYEIPGTSATDPVECPTSQSGTVNPRGGEEVFAALAQTRCVTITAYGYHLYVGEETGEETDSYYLQAMSCQVGDPARPETQPALNWGGGGFSVSGTGPYALGQEVTVDISGSISGDGQTLTGATASVAATDGSFETRFTVSNLKFGGNLNPELGLAYAVDGAQQCAANLSNVSSYFFSNTQTCTYDHTDWEGTDTPPWLKVRFSKY